MKNTTIQEGAANWASLQAFVNNAMLADRKLANKVTRFTNTLHKRQKRETERILSKPNSKAWKDYMSVPV